MDELECLVIRNEIDLVDDEGVFIAIPYGFKVYFNPEIDLTPRFENESIKVLSAVYAETLLRKMFPDQEEGEDV